MNKRRFTQFYSVFPLSRDNRPVKGNNQANEIFGGLLKPAEWINTQENQGD
jgi:hypothetical protein